MEAGKQVSDDVQCRCLWSPIDITSNQIYASIVGVAKHELFSKSAVCANNGKIVARR